MALILTSCGCIQAHVTTAYTVVSSDILLKIVQKLMVILRG